MFGCGGWFFYEGCSFSPGMSDDTGKREGCREKQHFDLGDGRQHNQSERGGRKVASPYGNGCLFLAFKGGGGASTCSRGDAEGEEMVRARVKRRGARLYDPVRLFLRDREFLPYEGERERRRS